MDDATIKRIKKSVKTLIFITILIIIGIFIKQDEITQENLYKYQLNFNECRDTNFYSSERFRKIANDKNVSFTFTQSIENAWSGQDPVKGVGNVDKMSKESFLTLMKYRVVLNSIFDPKIVRKHRSGPPCI